MAARTEIITSLDALEALQPAWAELHGASGGGPFSSMDWMLAWTAAFGSEAVPRIGCVWRDGQLTAALPLGLKREPLWRGGPRLRKLSMLCSNRAGFHDALAVPGHEADAAALLEEMLAARDCDVADLAPMRAAGAFGWMAAAHRGGHLRSRQRQELRAALCRHDDGLDACLARRSRKFRRLLRAGHRALQQREHEILTADRPGGGADRILDGVLALSARKVRLGTGGGSSQRTRVFFEELWRRLSARGRMVLHLLTIDGRPAASSLCAEAGSISYRLALDFDVTHGRVSPGRIMAWRGIETAVARGLKTSNTLRSTQFLDHLGDSYETFHRLRICRRYRRADLWLAVRELLRPVGQKARKLQQLAPRKNSAFFG
ncbi:GNAT family N-acetyltransferase [Leisingera sp. McT4-56]|uniref:GNAT family N-acetyltransferase n=1 Tax=Leisingera sp. McT4-56 TaxID=2881255 RepID=UPI001CF85711|nr:GNAT family N-acetyltransferase [Leisingera sp. McT4-56]MCB4457457.1 GNAT family N-acetyltransferase [Leisingera sp. McT4-56]